MEAVNWSTYDSYKDSGAEWLGAIPDKWTTLRAKFIWRESSSISSDGTESLLSVSQKNGVIPREEDSRSEDLAGYRHVRKGDLVSNIMLAWMGALGVSKYEGIVSPAYSVYRLIAEADTGYLDYLYRTSSYLAEFARRSTGVVPSRWRLYTENFGEVLTLLPSSREQRAIARFLDEKCAKVDEAVRIKEEQIALLRERRQILIQEAVTRGLNSVAPMKDSGIDWIGKIPAHWHVKRIRNVSKSVSTGRTPPSSAAVDYFERGTIPWYTPSDVLECGEFDLSSKSINHSAVNHGHVDLYPANSVYFIGIGGTLGKANLSNKVASCNQQFNVIVPSEAVFPNWILNWLNSYRDVIFAMTDFTTIPIINQANTKSIAIAVPPRHEQSAILSHLSAGRDKIGVAISVKAEQINALREYKTTLINAAVTGKIKVA